MTEERTAASASLDHPLSRTGSLRPILTLVFLAPFIAEVLYGSTHITTLFLLIPQMAVYGCGALIIRVLVRRRGLGWPAILLLGVAYGIAEECLILQTSLAPLFFARDPYHVYGRAVGVNWPYLIWAVGYESLWSIVIPIQVTEIIFPSRRNDAWLGKKGLAAAIADFHGRLGVRLVHLESSCDEEVLSWTAISKFPWLTLAVAALMVAALGFAALIPHALENNVQPAHARDVRPWLLAVLSFVWSLAWFVLVLLSTGYVPSVPAWAAIVLGAVLAALAFAIFRRLAQKFVLRDRHRLALISGALLASMLVGVLASGITLPIDMAGKIVFDLAALVLLAVLFRRVQTENAKLPG